MQRNNYLYFTLLVLFLVAASIAFSYSPMIFDPNYQGEDFIFLSQASQIGYVKSFLLSYKDHFIPLYRILWGALHLLFKNAISIRAVILGFHIINAALIFHIVRRHTKSVALATIASVTFGFSQKVASGVVWCINGVWGISLCFILLMSICLERFLRNNEYAGSPADENCGNPSNAISDSSSVASPSGTHPGNFRYYYAALVSFAVALGFFTISISGGTVIWLFMYARVLRAKKFRQNLGYHLKIIIPFLVILAVYLPIRSHFNAESRPYHDPITKLIFDRPDIPLSKGIDVIRNAPPGFYLDAIQGALPYFPGHYFLVLAFVALLFVKELAYRKRGVYIVLMWPAFAVMALAMPVIGRIFFIFKGSGQMDVLLFPWYFCYPIAGISITLGLLLRPTPSMEKAIAKLSPITRISIFSFVIALLVILNYGNARAIKTITANILKSNSEFNELVTKYRHSMDEFLQSSPYTSERKIYFMDAGAGDEKEYPLNWAVMQRDIFHLTFPHIRNIVFVNELERGKDFYVWTPESVTYRLIRSAP